MTHNKPLLETAGVLGVYLLFLTMLAAPAAVAATSYSPPYNNSLTSPASSQTGGTCTTFYNAGGTNIGSECAFAYDQNGWEPIYAKSNDCCGGAFTTEAWGQYDANGNGPVTTSTSGYLYLIEGVNYYGSVATDSPSEANSYLYATLTYHYTYCFQQSGGGIICNPASVNSTPVIWDAVLDGNAVLQGSASWAHLFSGVSGGSLNQYWASEGAQVEAYSQSNCFVTCTSPTSSSNFNGGSNNYYIYITYIEICNYNYCSPS
jgi:hypothetical protein